MAVLVATAPTLLDLAQLPKNKDAKDVVNLLGQSNPMLQDAPAIPCNMGTYHQTTVLTGLPSPTWGKLYKGIPATKGSRQMVKDTTGFLEAAGEVDTRLVDDVESAEEKASIRFEEAQGQLEAMAQTAADALFYSDTDVSPEKPMGLQPRFNSLSAENGGQIIDGGGVGADNASIWMISWDKRTCHLIYPKHGSIGIQRQNRPPRPVADGSGDTYYVYREEFTWHLGMSVRDWRYVARLANIDVSNLTSDASAGANLIDLLTDMYYAHEGRRSAIGKTVIYMNTTLLKFLDFQARNVPTNLFLTFQETGVNAKEVLHFRGMPIMESDALHSAEAQVV